jgi:hypothetical protein
MAAWFFPLRMTAYFSAQDDSFFPLRMTAVGQIRQLRRF